MEPVNSAYTTQGALDPFASLPTEMRSFILELLPSRDVANLRLASRALASVPLSDVFWKSRFFYGRDLDHVFEVKQYFLSTAHRGRWKSIFDLARNFSNDPNMHNRKRIWRLSLALGGLVKRTVGRPCHGLAIQSFYEPHCQPAEGPDLIWVTAIRLVKFWNKDPPDSVIAPLGSRVFHTRRITLPPGGLSAVSASTIDIFGRRYISGFTFRDREDELHYLGYIHTTTTLPLHSEEDGPLYITELCLAQDKLGIRGLTIKFDTGAVSPWFGDHDELPKRRLVLETKHGGSTALDTFMGGFDVSSTHSRRP